MASPLFSEPSPPKPLSNLAYKPRIVQLPNGDLWACTLSVEGGTQTVAVQVSKDLGETWGDQQNVIHLDKDEGSWGGPEVLVDRDGLVHIFLVCDLSKGFDEKGQPKNIPKGRYGTTRYDIYHTKSNEERTEWEKPKTIWKGYTGALNSVVQMKSGRILLPFSYLTDRNWRDRGEGLDAFTFRGFFNSTLVYSDDNGDTWRLLERPFKVTTPDIVSAYGAVEPVAVELSDGRVWMLIRTQQGRFYESFSEDGANWTPAKPNAILSSDSPAGLVRLPDDRIVLLWNKSLRFPYAHGGRHVMHAAISLDGGKTWRGHREVAWDPLRHEPPPPSGDHGTAYPFPTALQDGRVLFTTGQGEGRALIVLLDPDWLLETSRRDDFSQGLEKWTHFGTKGVEIQDHPDRSREKVLSIRRIDSEWPAAAVWNFPAGKKGKLKMEFLVDGESPGLQLGLTDHYSVPFDIEDTFSNLFQVGVHPVTVDAPSLSVEPGKWHTLEFNWDCEERICRITMNGKEAMRLPLRHDTADGICYLRLRSLGDESDGGAILVNRVAADALESSLSD